MPLGEYRLTEAEMQINNNLLNRLRAAKPQVLKLSRRIISPLDPHPHLGENIDIPTDIEHPEEHVVFDAFLNRKQAKKDVADAYKDIKAADTKATTETLQGYTLLEAEITNAVALNNPLIIDHTDPNKIFSGIVGTPIRSLVVSEHVHTHDKHGKKSQEVNYTNAVALLDHIIRDVLHTENVQADGSITPIFSASERLTLLAATIAFAQVLAVHEEPDKKWEKKLKHKVRDKVFDHALRLLNATKHQEYWEYLTKLHKESDKKHNRGHN